MAEPDPIFQMWGTGLRRSMGSVVGLMRNLGEVLQVLCANTFLPFEKPPEEQTSQGKKVIFTQ